MRLRSRLLFPATLFAIASAPNLFATCTPSLSVSLSGSVAHVVADLSSGCPNSTAVSVWVQRAGDGDNWGFVTGDDEIGATAHAETNYDMACFRSGTYTFKTTSKCYNPTPTSSCADDVDRPTVYATISINTTPTVSVSAATDGMGVLVAHVAYNFPNTAGRDKYSRVVNLYLDGSASVWDYGEFDTESGAWDSRKAFGCLAPGTHTLLAKAVACNGIEIATATTNFTIARTPVVSAAFASPDASGVISGTITYGFPNTTAGNRALSAEIDMSTDGSGAPQWQPLSLGNPNLLLSGTLPLNLQLPCGSGPHKLRLTATSCPTENPQQTVYETTVTAPEDCATVDHSCAPDPAAPPGTCPLCVGKPIHVGSGDVTTSLALFALDAVFPLKFGLTYHSQPPLFESLNRRPLGPGWTHTYNERIGGVGPQRLAWTTSSGSQVFFDQVTPELWIATRPSRMPQKLSLVNGEYRIKDLDGTVKSFDRATGRWLWVEDRWGNRISGLYTGDQLTQLTDALGRTVTLAYTGNALTSIALPGNSAVWRFAMSGSALQIFDPLHSATTPWRTYSYVTAAALPRLSEVRDDGGKLLEGHTYDAQGRGRTSFSEGDRDLVTVAYDTPGVGQSQITEQLDSGVSQTVTYALTYQKGRFQPSEVTGRCTSCGSVSDHDTYTYDSAGNPQTVTDANGVVTRWTWDPNGNVITKTDAYGTALQRTITYYREIATWPNFVTKTEQASVTGNGLATTTSSWNAGETVLTTTRTGRINATAAAVSMTTTRTYDSRHRLLTQDGPRTDVSDVTTYTYYADDDVDLTRRGRLHTVVNAAGHVTTFNAYDIFGTPTSVTDANGATQESETDAVGRTKSQTSRAIAGDPNEPVDYVSRSIFDSRDRLAESITPRGLRTTFTWEDGTNRLADQIRLDAAGNQAERRHFVLNQAGAMTSEQLQSCALPAAVCATWVTKRTENYAFDSKGRLRTLTHADGTTVEYTYTAVGNVETIKDENHSVANTTYTYESLRRLKSVSQSLGSGSVVTQYDYDKDDNLKAVTDPNGNVTTYAFDDFGRMQTQSSPVTGTTSYTYDPAGNLITIVDSGGAVVTRTYDALNRVRTATGTRTGASQESISWTYDEVAASRGKGRLTSVADPAGSASYAYDRRGLLTSERRTIGGSSYDTTYAYDADGNRTAIGYPSGTTANWQFDYAGRPSAVSRGTVPVVTSASYLPFGPATEIVFGNGTTQTLAFDSRFLSFGNKLTGPSAATIADYTYGHDAAGNTTSIHDAVNHAYDRDFLYDDLSRLVTANTGSALWASGSYTWDAIGNIRSQALGSRTSVFSYEGLTPRLATVHENGVSSRVVLDAAGNEVRAGTATYDYTPMNHLTSAGTLTYTYDARGVRTITSGPCPTAARPAPLRAGAGGASGTFSIDARVDCSWAATSGAAWLTLTGPTTGMGPGNVSYSVAPNTSALGRATTITLSGDLSFDVTQPGSTIINTSADFNGDGVADLLWHNDVTGEVRANGLDGLGVATTAALGTHEDLFEKLVGVGDFSGDGRADLFWRNGRTGELKLDVIALDGTITTSPVSADATKWVHVAGVGDLNGDGKADVVTRDDQTGAVAVRLMSGSGLAAGVEIVASSPRETIVAGIGDLDGDGHVDVVSYNRRSGEVYGRLIGTSGTTVVSAGVIATEPDTRWRVAALGDFDGDGKADLIWRNRSTGATEVQLMNGLLGAARVAVSADTDTRWELAGTGDANGDGRSDLLWRHRGTGAVRVDLMNGTQIAGMATVYTESDPAWTLVTPSSAAASQAPARADFSADGTSDIVWRSSAANAQNTFDIAVWEMKGTTVLNPDDTVFAALSDPAQSLQTAADLNGDGTGDFLWRNRNTNWLSIWEMNGRSLMAGHTFAQLIDADWQVQGAGDVTGDGVADIILRNTRTSAVALWEMSGGSLARGDVIATLADPNWQVQGVGDFYGDGRTGVLWRNALTGNVAIWRINSRVVSGSTIASTDPSWTIQGVGDYNGDGRSDILWRSTGGEIHIWEMNGSSVVRDVLVGTLTDPNWKIQAASGDFGGDRVWDVILRRAAVTVDDLAMWQMKASLIRAASTFANVDARWILEALDRNGSSGTTINALATTGGPARWWTPVTGVPPFWGPPPAAQPQPPWIGGPPAMPQIPFWTGPLKPPGVPWWTPLSGVPAPPITGAPPAPLLNGPTAASQSLPADEAEPSRRRTVATTTARGNSAVAAATMNSDRRYSLYTPELNLLAETESTSAPAPAIQYEYIWFGGRPAAQIETATGAIHYYFDDHLGTPLLTTNAAGAVDWRVEREPFGKIYTIRSGATRHQPLAFPGQEEGGEGELSYNIFRWYRAGWGRYTQADPLRTGLFLQTGGNPPAFVQVSGVRASRSMSKALLPDWYSYTGDSPIGHTDPWGLLRDCDQEHIQCFNKCWNNCPPWPIKKGNAGHYKYCQTKCLAEYMECEAENEAEKLKDDVKKWFNNPPPHPPFLPIPPPPVAPPLVPEPVTPGFVPIIHPCMLNPSLCYGPGGSA